jgi:NAD(P)-dependent dehydrogenase (short-subunit alcohol dehydrogenase family)
MMGLEGKVVLDAGASRGFGRAVIVKLGLQGAVVYINFAKDESVDPVAAEAGIPGHPGHTAYKAGIIGLTKALAKEQAFRNLCVNDLSPGLIETDMTIDVTENHQRSLPEQIPLKRLGTPEDAAGTVAFLVSEKANYHFHGQSA